VGKAYPGYLCCCLMINSKFTLHTLIHTFPLETKLQYLAQIFHELPTATEDMTVLPGVLGSRILRRTVQVRLGSNSLRLSGGTAISTVSRQQFMKYLGWFKPKRCGVFGSAFLFYSYLRSPRLLTGLRLLNPRSKYS
jgi:hypothetical protein